MQIRTTSYFALRMLEYVELGQLVESTIVVMLGANCQMRMNMSDLASKESKNVQKKQEYLCGLAYDCSS